MDRSEPAATVDRAPDAARADADLLRVDPEDFGDDELELVHVARTLREAARAEDALSAAGLTYAVVPETYRTRLLLVIPRMRVGAFFYVRVPEAHAARETLEARGHQPVVG